MPTRLTCMQVMLTDSSSSCNRLLQEAGALEVRDSEGIEGVVGVRARRVQDVCAVPARTPSPVAWVPLHGSAALAGKACLKTSPAVYSQSMASGNSPPLMM